MSTRHWVMGALLVSSSTLVLAGPTSLLPPGFEEPEPAPAPAPTPTPSASPTPSGPAPSTPASGGTTSQPVVQATPSRSSGSGSGGGGRATSSPASGSSGPTGAAAAREVLRRLPSLKELEEMSAQELDDALGLTPTFDVPPTARRTLKMIGVVGEGEGGLPAASLARQPESLVRAAINGNRGQLVSRWGHILLRRTLASRLDAPDGLGAVDFAAMRTALLNRMGESQVARQLVQDVDSANYNAALGQAALDAFVASGDIVGICPAVRLKDDLLETDEWNMIRHVCAAYSNEERRAIRDLDRMLNGDKIPDIDVLLAQRFAGAAGDGRRAVNIEWNDVEELNDWRYGFSAALGVDIPNDLWTESGNKFSASAAVSPAFPLERRLQASSAAAARGVLSSQAMVDLYGVAFEQAEAVPDWGAQARLLRNAYVAANLQDKIAAIRDLQSAEYPRSGLVLTAYAAARIAPDASLAEDAELLVASMLQAGLDRNALQWASVVDEGSAAWAMLAVAQPSRNEPVSEGAFNAFYSNDESEEYRRSQFLLAGLAGLGRLDGETTTELQQEFGLDFARSSRWSELMTMSASVRNQTLVALLAGVGMQGEDWSKMTPRHLYHIVKALNDVGLSAEARMIAAEAVSQG